MAGNILFHLAVLTVLLSVSAFFSAAEAALFSLNLVRVRHLEAKAGRRGRTVAGLLLKPQRLIITIIIGNELANVTASSLVGAYLITLLGPQGRWYAIAFTAAVLLTLGDIIPKTLGVAYPAGISLGVAPPLDFISRLLAVPAGMIQSLTGIFHREREADLITEMEFKGLVREGGRTGVLDKEEEGIIYNILELGDLAVSGLMVPRTDMSAMEDELPVGRALEIIREKGHSRIPLFRGDPDNVTGVLHVKDLLARRARGELDMGMPVGALAKRPFFVPEKMKADRLLVAFRDRRVHMAVVVDEYGGTAGIITIEDLLRRLFEGVTRTPPPSKRLYQKIEEGAWSVSGRLSIEKFRRLFGGALPGGGYRTVGGMLLHLFGRLPRRGESLRWGNLLFRVTAVEEHRIVGVRVEVLAGGGKS